MEFCIQITVRAFKNLKISLRDTIIKVVTKLKIIS